MKEPIGVDGDNAILFCTRPWRMMGAAVVALVAITFLWGAVVLATYRDDDRFGNDRNLSVAQFLSRNIALPGSISLPDAVAPAVVAIDGSKINGEVVASGAIVGANGYVLTTLHAVEGLTDITVRVRTASGLQAFSAQIVKKAPTHDLVMLKIKSPGSFLYLSLADTSKGMGGEPVFAFGQGSSGNLVVREGAVAAQSTPISAEGLQISHLRFTDAVYTWEQNGGPVVNSNGVLIGTTLAVQDSTGAVRGYVVPADVINAHFRDVVNFKLVAPAPAQPQAAAQGIAPGPRMIEAAAPPMTDGLGAGPMVEPGQPVGAAAGWWIRAANQVGAAGQPAGMAQAPNGPPQATTAAGPDFDHVLGMRLAGFAIEDLIGLTLLALAKGVIGGMMTMGGGVFLVAGMMMFFGYGLFLIRPVAYLTNIFVYSASSLRHHRNGLIQWDEVKSLAPWAVIGVVVGYFIGNAISDRIIELLLGVFAVLISAKAAHEIWVAEGDAILLAKNAENGGAPSPTGPAADTGLELDDEPPVQPSHAASFEALAKPAMLALPMGIMSGILGITGGVVEVPLQHYIGKVPLKNAIANSAALVFCASLTGTILSFTHGTSTGLIDWRAPLTLAAILIPASFAGGVVGAHLTKLAPKKLLKGIFAVLMLAVAIRMFVGH